VEVESCGTILSPQVISRNTIETSQSAEPTIRVQITDTSAIPIVNQLYDFLLTLAEKPAEQKNGSKPECIRLDRVWSTETYRYETKPSINDHSAGQYDEYAFQVVRRFDHKNRYEYTELVILNTLLKKACSHILEKVKGVSFEESRPTVHQNMIFLHLDEF
jgi:hypothetical protein